MQSPLDQYLAAISSIESGGDYNAQGPVTNSGDRAYGKYQVMGSNIPAWTQIATGKKMSTSQYLNDPDAQEAVARKLFGGYVDQYGPRGAAAMWFSGKPDVNSTASDGSNTVPQYVSKFDRALAAQQQGGMPSDALGYAGGAPLTGDALLQFAQRAGMQGPQQPVDTGSPPGSPNDMVRQDFASIADPNSPATAPARQVGSTFNDLNRSPTANPRVAQAFDALNAAKQTQVAGDPMNIVPPGAGGSADAGGATPPNKSFDWRGAIKSAAPDFEGAGAYLMSISHPGAGAGLLAASNAEQAMKAPQWGVTGKDPWTGVEQYGWIDRFGQKVSNATAPSSGSAGEAQAAQNAFGNMSPTQVNQQISDLKAKGATQEQILQSLPPMVSGMIGGMLKGAQTPQMLARQGQMRNLFIGMASQIDPNFDETSYGMRQAQARDLGTGGKLGQNLISANQVVNHAGQLFDDIDPLKNPTNSSFINSIVNGVRGQTDPEYQKAAAAFDTHKLALSSELVKLMRGTGGAESDIQAWQKEFNSANSEPALKTAVQNSLQIMKGRVEAATNQYNVAFGSHHDADHFLSPNANATIQRIMGTPQQAAAQGQPAQASAANIRYYQGKAYTRGPNGEAVPYNQ